MLHTYVTNEFKNSAVAQSKRDVITPVDEGKPMLIAAGIIVVLLAAIFAIQY
jgi:hypothetical protein